jgi:hypothetical protein
VLGGSDAGDPFLPDLGESGELLLAESRLPAGI